MITIKGQTDKITINYSLRLDWLIYILPLIILVSFYGSQLFVDVPAGHPELIDKKDFNPPGALDQVNYN